MAGKKNPQRRTPCICAVCGVSFTGQKRSDIYCSKPCASRGSYERKRQTRVPAVCGVCGCEYLAWPHRVGQWHWCSKKCAYIGRRDSKPVGAESPCWKGGRHINPSGYVVLYIGPPGRYQMEHRLVMEEVLGRPLERREQVHHRNGIKHDNRRENLELWTGRNQPNGVRLSESPHCPTCTCGGGPSH